MIGHISLTGNKISNTKKCALTHKMRQVRRARRAASKTRAKHVRQKRTEALEERTRGVRRRAKRADARSAQTSPACTQTHEQVRNATWSAIGRRVSVFPLRADAQAAVESRRARPRSPGPQGVPRGLGNSGQA